MRPLPRSLAPLPGESLPGFLLRLSHRLDVSPAQIAAVTGLGPVTRGLRIANLVDIELPDAERFARLARLSLEEVGTLTLRSLRGNYPPLGASKPARWLTMNESWVLFRATRYCPLCLAGDGSPVQIRHGGAWKLSWRLSLVFACVEHDRLLYSVCPACRLPAHSRSPAWTPLLLPDPARVLHPLQCRTAEGRPQKIEHAKVCLGRFDTVRRSPNTLAHRETTTLLAFQRTLNNVLGFNSPAGPTMHDESVACTVVADLQTVATLLHATWPAAGYETNYPRLAEDFTRYLSSRSTRRACDQTVWQGRPSPLLPPPPLDPAACGSLLALAFEILRLEPSRMLASLAPILATSGAITDRLRRDISTDSPHSANLKAAFGLIPLRPARRGTASDPNHSRLSYRHVPQRLPAPWYIVHLDDMREAALARATALRLVQELHGISASTAADLLELPGDDAERLMARLQRNFGHCEWMRFCAGVTAISHDLASLTPLVDYAHRRKQMADWHLAPATWEALTKDLQDKPDETVKAAAEIFIWTRVTDGVARFAPTWDDVQSIDDTRIVQLTGQMRTSLRVAIPKANTCTNMTILAHHLAELAHAHAQAIDATALPSH